MQLVLEKYNGYNRTPVNSVKLVMGWLQTTKKCKIGDIYSVWVKTLRLQFLVLMVLFYGQCLPRQDKFYLKFCKAWNHLLLYALIFFISLISKYVQCTLKDLHEEEKRCEVEELGGEKRLSILRRFFSWI